MYAGSVSNDWLESFKKCHNIGKFAVNGEAADVGEETVEVWHERVKSFMVGYKPEDVWNEDGTGCFYKALPGGKKAKEGLILCKLYSVHNACFLQTIT